MSKPFPEEIRAFCGTCDSFKQNGGCNLDDFPSIQAGFVREVGVEKITQALKNAGIAQELVNLSRSYLESLISMTKQERYVDRNWCGWASVNGVRGQMTKDGFTV